jgi:hypothetical protein
VISNPAGFQKRVYFNGAAVELALPVSVVAHHQVLNITITTYVDQLHVTLIALREAIPDLQRLAKCTASAVATLEADLARLTGRALRRHLSGRTAPFADDRSFRETLAPWLASRPDDLLADHRLHYLPARRPPWFDSGIDVAVGDEVTLLADGRVDRSSAARAIRTPSRRPPRAGCGSPAISRANGPMPPGDWPRRGATMRRRVFAKDTRVPGLVLAEAGRHDGPVPTPDDRLPHAWRRRYPAPGGAVAARPGDACRTAGGHRVPLPAARCRPGRTRRRTSWCASG